MTTVVTGVAMAMLAVAALLIVWRLVVGPTPLDRIVASDVMIAVVIAGTGSYSVLSGSSTGLSIVLVLCLVGFTGAVGVARLISSSTSIRQLFDRRQAMQEADDE